MPVLPWRPSLLVALVAMAAPLPLAVQASTPQAWAAAERQADQECRFWLAQRGYLVLQRLPLDASGATSQPTDSGLQLRYRVSRNGANPKAALPKGPSSLTCSTRRPLFSPEPR